MAWIIKDQVLQLKQDTINNIAVYIAGIHCIISVNQWVFFFPYYSVIQEFTKTDKKLGISCPSKIDANKINSKLKLKRVDAYIHVEKIFGDGWSVTIV